MLKSRSITTESPYQSCRPSVSQSSFSLSSSVPAEPGLWGGGPRFTPILLSFSDGCSTTLLVFRASSVLLCDEGKLRIFQILKSWFLFVEHSFLGFSFSSPPKFTVSAQEELSRPSATSATFQKTLEHSSGTLLTTLQHSPLPCWAIPCPRLQS